MRRLLTFAVFLLSAISLTAGNQQENSRRVKYKGGPAYIYRIALTDKQGCGYSLDHPTRFLSRRSVERRKRQRLPIDSTDLPVSSRYARLLSKKGVDLVGASRWQNTLLIRIKDTTLIEGIRQLSCVRSCRMVWQSPDSVDQEIRTKYHDYFEVHDSIEGEVYGTAAKQIRSLQGHRLHDIGLRGKGMMIAVIDGGFKNVDRIPAFQQVDIRGWCDFINPDTPHLFSETDHGTRVLSAMAISKPFYFVGTAPQASYWLLRSEDQQTEQEVEEDYWTMAAEFADSVGCDVINSSVGYNEYDYSWMSHQLWQLDGRTAFISKSASLLASKGIILVNSAGNSGMGPWKKIGVPADADHILTIGAISDQDSRRIAPFSSVGPSQDLRTKPDLVAIGAPARLVNGRGVITNGMGTSFSSPIICGLMACLWQGMPQKTAKEMIELIRQTGSNSQHPDNIYGYGLPNFWRAYMIGKKETSNNQ